MNTRLSSCWIFHCPESLKGLKNMWRWPARSLQSESRSGGRWALLLDRGWRGNGQISLIATQHFFLRLDIALLTYICSFYLQQSFTHWPWGKISKVSLFAKSQNWVPVSQGDPGLRPKGRDWWWSCRPHSPWSQCASWWAFNVVIILLFCCDRQLRW